MNGRVYDYNVGRFMSVDPFIQEPGNSQSVNPYSYIMNNPLAGTDPTGYIAVNGPKLPGPGDVTCLQLICERPWKDRHQLNGSDEGNGSGGDDNSGGGGNQISDILGQGEISNQGFSNTICGDCHPINKSPKLNNTKKLVDAFAPDVASLIADIVPVVSSVKSAVQVVTGKDAITGDEISRVEEGAGILLGVIPFGKILVKGDDAVDIGDQAFEFYMQKANELDVSTVRDSAVFYSGKGNRELAEGFADMHGKTTLEMTIGGNWLDNQKLFDSNSSLTPQQAVQVWSRLSQRFAQGASGNTVGFVEGARQQSIFNTVEYPALRTNEKVTNVITGGN